MHAPFVPEETYPLGRSLACRFKSSNSLVPFFMSSSASLSSLFEGDSSSGFSGPSLAREDLEALVSGLSADGLGDPPSRSPDKHAKSSGSS
jgi:hypothetical protein